MTRRANRGKGRGNQDYREQRQRDAAVYALLAKLMREWRRVYLLS